MKTLHFLNAGNERKTKYTFLFVAFYNIGSKIRKILKLSFMGGGGILQHPLPSPEVPPLLIKHLALHYTSGSLKLFVS